VGSPVPRRATPGQNVANARGGIAATLEALLRNAPPIAPTSVRAMTPDREVRAIALLNWRGVEFFRTRIRDSEVTDRLARGVGIWGSIAEYLHNPVQPLEAMLAERLAPR
jgi:hypothetical protein